MQTYSTPTSNGPSSGGGASGAADQAKEQAQRAAGQAKGALRSQVDLRSTEAGEKVGSFASDVRSIGDQLREQGKDQAAKLADEAADRAEQLSGYLTNSDADGILADVEDFGRRQPWAVIGAGVALGVLASRFLKASSSRRHEERSDSARARLPAPASSGNRTAGQGDTGTAATSGIGTDPIVTPGSIGADAPAPAGLEGSR